MTRWIAAVIVLALTLAAPANADDDEFGGDDTTQAICLESSLGKSLGQIARDLQAGDSRWNRYQANLRVWDTVVLQSECG